MRLVVIGICAAALLTGCAGVMRAGAAMTSDYDLCRVANTDSRPEVRQIGWEEIAKRGLDCQRVARSGPPPDTSKDVIQGLQLLNAARPQPLPVATSPAGFFKRSYNSGFNTVCVYDQIGSEYVVTIPSGICPLSPP